MQMQGRRSSSVLTSGDLFTRLCDSLKAFNEIPEEIIVYRRSFGPGDFPSEQEQLEQARRLRREQAAQGKATSPVVCIHVAALPEAEREKRRAALESYQAQQAGQVSGLYPEEPEPAPVVPMAEPHTIQPSPPLSPKRRESVSHFLARTEGRTDLL
jgi:hypothetical protein